MEVLIKNYALPQEGEQVSITILSDGSVIEHFKTGNNGSWSSYKSGGVKAIELPPHGDLIDRMELAMNVAKAQEELKGKDIDPFMLLGDVLRWIALAPTILEARE